MRRAPVFVDTAYFVALLNRRDALHARARALASSWATRDVHFVTTDGVLIEPGNFFARSPLRSLAATTIHKIRNTSGWTVDRISAGLLDRAEARYRAHPDKGWSLTDCLSMESMLDHGATEVATTDHHFAQAGFHTLMSAPDVG
jgi:Predicted nucleic acid-binding protein, contains PIN domain